MNSTPKVKGFWTNFSERLLDAAYPPRCSLCQSFSPKNPCIQCLGEMQRNDPIIEYKTGGELAYQASVYRYHGRPGQAVRLLKYERCTGLAAFMAQEIAKAVEETGLEVDLVVPIPIHWYRQVTRGFNQSDLLASQLDKLNPILRRVRPTQPQAGLTTAQRLKNLDGAFGVVADVTGKSILLIDDVVTSGQTARECAKALRSAGAQEVGIMAFCGEV